MATKYVNLSSIYLFLFLIILTVPLSSRADVNASVVEQLIKQHHFKTKGISVYVRAVDSEKPLLSFQAQKALNPASTIKLVTTAIALDQMGAGYRWNNEILYTGTIDDGTLKGDLYFRGNGDPYLTPERFWRLLYRVYLYGIENIDGNLYVDDSYFQPESIDYAAFDNQPYRTYHVGPSAVLVGFQATELNFSVNHKKGAVNIVPFPNAEFIAINNQVKLRRSGSCGRWQKRLQITPVKRKHTLQIKISGNYAEACGKKTLYRRVSSRADHFELFFRPIWKQIGGKLQGEISRQKTPPSAKALMNEESISLSETIRFINKFSNNVMTRQVLLSLGAQQLGAPGTTQKGIQAIDQWLDKKIAQGIIHDRKALRLDNGSGLSRKTRVSAQLLGELLHYVYQQAYMPDFIASLPITGYDGTMAHRFSGEKLLGQIYMKTGLLDFVQSMGGFVTAASGKRYIVVMLHNDKRAHTMQAERLQNDVLRWVYDH